MTAKDEIDSIFSAFGKLSELSQKAHEVRTLESQNQKLETTCGSCVYWMTQQCPMETKTYKVSMGKYKCQKFSMDKWTSDFMIKNQNKVNEIKASL